MGRKRTRYIKETELGDTLSERLQNRETSKMMQSVAMEWCNKRAKSIAKQLEDYAFDEQKKGRDDYVAEFMQLVMKSWNRYLEYVKNMDYDKYVSSVELKLSFKNAIQRTVSEIENSAGNAL